MLDERDLQAIAKLIDTSVRESEARTAEKIDTAINTAIKESEARTAEKIDTAIKESEARTAEKIKESEDRMKALMEGYFEPKFNLLADQFQLIQDKMVLLDDLVKRDDRLDVLEAVVKRHSREIEKLKKAQ